MALMTTVVVVVIVMTEGTGDGHDVRSPLRLSPGTLMGLVDLPIATCCMF